MTQQAEELRAAVQETLSHILQNGTLTMQAHFESVGHGQMVTTRMDDSWKFYENHVHVTENEISFVVEKQGNSMLFATGKGKRGEFASWILQAKKKLAEGSLAKDVNLLGIWFVGGVTQITSPKKQTETKEKKLAHA